MYMNTIKSALLDVGKLVLSFAISFLLFATFIQLGRLPIGEWFVVGLTLAVFVGSLCSTFMWFYKLSPRKVYVPIVVWGISIVLWVFLVFFFQ